MPSAVMRKAVVQTEPWGTAAVSMAKPGTARGWPAVMGSMETPAARFSRPESGL